MQRSKQTSPLREVIRASRTTLAWALLFSACVNILYLTPSLYMMQIYDRVLQSGSISTLALLTIALALALAALSSLDGVRAALMSRASAQLDERLARPLTTVAIRQRHDGKRRQIVREFDTFKQTIAGPASSAVMDAPWAPIYMLICFLIHPLLGLLTVLGAALLVVIAVHNARAQRATVSAIEERQPRLYAAHEADQASGDAMRAMGMERSFIDRYLVDRQEVQAAQASAAFSNVRHVALSKFTRLALQSLALGLGAYLAIEQQVSLGAVIAASILSSRAFAPVDQITASWRSIGAARLTYQALDHALREAPDLSKRTSLPLDAGQLRFEHVTARAAFQSRVALLDATFTVTPGSLVGIVGPSGAGKSTLCRLAAGALAPDAGHVRLDGASLRDWEADELGVHIGFVPQDLGLIGGTIAENISRFEGATEDRDVAVVRAAKLAGAHDMILRLPEAYETRLAPGGRGLSLGQAQRVSIARALYRDPKILIFDEPNAHLDEAGAAQLISAIALAKARGATILIAAHRGALLEHADQLLAIKDGRVRVFGRRGEGEPESRDTGRARLVEASAHAPSEE